MPFTPQVLISGMDGGMNTHDYPENLELNESPLIRNMDFTAKTLRKARGFEEFGTESETDTGFTLYKHTLLGVNEMLIKTVSDKIKFYDTVSDTWHLLSSQSFEENVSFFMASFNGYLYFCDGVNNYSRWRPSFSTIANSISIGATTIDLATGTGSRFATSGSGLIESDTFSWSGRTGDQLTGVTGVTANHAAGSTIIVEPDTSTYSTVPKCSVGAFFKNRMVIRDDANPNMIYHSKLATASSPQDALANFTIAGSGTGDAGSYPAPAAVIGMHTFISASNTPVLLIFCADGVAYSFNVTDSGSTTVATLLPFKVFNADLASSGAVADFENDIILLDKFKQIRTLGYQDVNTPANTRRLSDKIEHTIDSLTVDRAYAEFFQRKAYFIAKEDESDVNNFVVVKDTNPDAFAIYTHWRLNAICEYGDELYGLSSQDAKVYKLLTGLSANNSSIYSYYQTPALNYGAALIMKALQSIRIKGYISTSAALTWKVYFDTSETPFEFTISGNDNSITDPLTNVAIGTISFGTAVFGGDLPEGEELREFMAQLNMPTYTNFDTMYVTVENEQKNVDFELSKILFFVETQPAEVIRPDRNLSIT